MKYRNLMILLVFMFGISVLPAGAESDIPWGEVKDKHFIVYFENKNDRVLAQDLLRKAENYYQKIGEDIGYDRTNKMWTWDRRVQIYMFATQSGYMTKTGQPAWSTGYADKDFRLFDSKTIMTFHQETGFDDGLLPHEISHLILHDFVRDKTNIPVWFDEGVAQLQEKDKKIMVRRIMKNLVNKNMFIPFDKMMKMDIRRERDPRVVEIFYAQALSVTDFLVTKYGQDKFIKLCRNLRDTQDFGRALLSAYSGIFQDQNDLQKKWAVSVAP